MKGRILGNRILDPVRTVEIGGPLSWSEAINTCCYNPISIENGPVVKRDPNIPNSMALIPWQLVESPDWRLSDFIDAAVYQTGRAGWLEAGTVVKANGVLRIGGPTPSDNILQYTIPDLQVGEHVAVVCRAASPTQTGTSGSNYYGVWCYDSRARNDYLSFYFSEAAGHTCRFVGAAAGPAQPEVTSLTAMRLNFCASTALGDNSYVSFMEDPNRVHEAVASDAFWTGSAGADTVQFRARNQVAGAGIGTVDVEWAAIYLGGFN